MDNSKKIIFLPSNERNVRDYLPLLRALQSRHCDICILSIAPLRNDKNALQNAVFKSGLPHKQLEVERFPNALHWSIQSLWKSKIEQSLRTCFNISSCDLLLTCFDGAVIQYTIVKEFKRQSIPVALIPDGVILPYHPAYPFTRWGKLKLLLSSKAQSIIGVGNTIGSSKPDLVLLLNHSGKTVFEKKGIDANNIVTVGSGKYDSFLATIEDRRHSAANCNNETPAIEQKQALTESSDLIRKIFFAHQFSLGLSLESERQLIYTMTLAMQKDSTAPPAALVVKFHPRSPHKLSDWERWREQMGLTDSNLIFADATTSSTQLLLQCMACITVFSTVGIEAIICDVPVINIRYIRANHELSFASANGAGLSADSPQELQAHINSLLNNDTLRSSLVQNCTIAREKELPSLKGNSLELTVNALTTLLEASTPEDISYENIS